MSGAARREAGPEPVNDSRDGDNDVVGPVLSCFCVFHGLLLGLIAVASCQNLDWLRSVSGRARRRFFLVGPDYVFPWTLTVPGSRGPRRARATGLPPGALSAKFVGAIQEGVEPAP